jgi:DNA modification methylase
MLEVNKIYNADCLELMKDIPDKSIDMILCDLPYGTTACNWDEIIPFNKHVLEPKGKKLIAIYEDEYILREVKKGRSYNEVKAEFDSLCKNGLWDEYSRIIKDNGAIVLTASQPFTSALVMSNIKNFRYEWIWEKERPTNIFFMKKQVGKVHENILVFYKKQPVYNPQMVARVSNNESKRDLSVLNNNGSKTHKNQTYRYSSSYNDKLHYPRSVQRVNRDRTKNAHPTQKPVALFEYLIKTYTNEGDIVLDNCAGSGTTAIACHNLNRNFICIERDIDYFNASVERLNNVKAQQKLF